MLVVGRCIDSINFNDKHKNTSKKNPLTIKILNT